MKTFIKTSTTINTIKIISSFVFVIFTAACENDDVPNLNIVTTTEVKFITETSAYGGGYINTGGKSYISSRAICWSTEPIPTITDSKTLNGLGDGSFFSNLTNLSPNTTYHVRAYAGNANGIKYGNNVTFTTRNSVVPILRTSTVSNRSSTKCTSGGVIVFEGSGDITARGVCWSTTNPPSILDSKSIDGMGTGVFTSSIFGLNPNLTYYIRAYATNSEGTGYGNTLNLKAYQSSVTDIDGNIYTTVSIVTQVWTLENLKVTKYQNGDPIQNIHDGALWNTTVAGAYCDYDNEPTNSDTYGRLYNWFAVSDNRKIAPEGWHVASYEDYRILIDYLGGASLADEKMKNGDFKALPGGKRNRDGVFYDKDTSPYFWTSTEYHEGSAWARYLVLDGGYLDIINLSKNYGFSVRCVRD